MNDLESLATDIETPAVRSELDDTKELLIEASNRGLMDADVRRLHPNDALEALIGSVIFASPLLVEDGVFDIATHLYRSTSAGLPVFLFLNIVFVVVMTHALLAWTGRRKTETSTLFGVFPTRVVMILFVSFVVATVLMTVWGRVGGWHQPGEAFARVIVLWTVGSLGAGLGDILSNRTAGDTPRPSVPALAGGAGDHDMANPDALSDAALLATLEEHFATLETTLRTAENRQRIRQVRQHTRPMVVGDRFGQQIRKYTSRDIAESFVGSIFFAIPLLVENGVFDVADYFLSFRVGQFPVFFLLNAAFVLLTVWTLLYWAGPQDVHITRPLFGIIPRRLVGIALVSFLTAGALMTMWGRVGGWQDPVVAIARISAVWTVAAFGATLGDILPGESSGDDLYDDLGELMD